MLRYFFHTTDTVSELQTGSLFITSGALGDENSSKRSKKIQRIFATQTTLSGFDEDMVDVFFNISFA